MTEIIAYAAFAYLAVQLLVVLVNILSFQVLRKVNYKTEASVSVLVPARNEARNIGSLLDDLSVVKGNIREILVYDDDSSDDTAAIVDSKRVADQRIRCIHGKGPEAGWLGKNYACDRLAREAVGEYMLFLDADVRVGEGVVIDSLYYLETKRLDLLSLFPVQKLKSIGEWLTVPLMNRILLGNLPLILIRLARMADFSAANGQFMLFRSEIYRKHWFHRMVKDEKVEDIRIMKRMKQLGCMTQTLLSGKQVSCRMYRGYGEAISGFSKNIHAFFGKRWLALVFYVILSFAGPVAVYYSLPRDLFLVYISGLVLFVGSISALSRQSVTLNLLALPGQLATLVVITVMAAYRQFTGNLSWKGRKIN